MTVADAALHSRSTEHKRHRAKLEPKVDTWKQDDSGWYVDITPDPEHQRAWEQQGRVDQLKDMIPFWLEGVMAAERGEEAGRMEEFLERLEEQWKGLNEWGLPADDGWGHDTGENVWGVNNWAAAHEAWMPGATWDIPEEPQEEPVQSVWGKQASGWDQPNQAWGEQASGWDQPDQAWGASTPWSDKSGTERETKSRPRRTHNGENREAWQFVERVATKVEANAEQRQRMHQFFEMPTQQKVQKIRDVIRSLQSPAQYD